ncbi:hypothetical protein GQ457_10G005900 [Hibiscus cannabinus]
MAMAMEVKTTSMTTKLQLDDALNHNQTLFLRIPLRLSLSDPYLPFPSRSFSVEAKVRTRTADRHTHHHNFSRHFLE